MLTASGTKAALSAGQVLLRSFLSGALLGISTTLAFAANAQGLPPIVGAILFPVGFIMIILLGLELVTGSFAVVPLALIGRRGTLLQVLSNLSFGYIGCLLGSLFYAAVYAAVQTQFHHVAPTPVALLLNSAAEAKTLGYMKMGHTGLAISFLKGVLCNWMVCMGSILAFSSTSSTGKILACWLPVMTFFAQGFEHSVVNMFVIPAGIMMGAKVSVYDWLVWNQIPVTLGNIVGGLLLVGIPLYLAYGRPKPERA
ncbi:MAG: formate/nitrite transporter family protein [Granulicella sp.]